MKVVFASRTGNVQSIVDRLSVDALEISSGDDAVSEPFLLITYTDGYGDVPMEVESFLNSNGDHLKGVIVSGDQVYGEAFCKAGDVISEQYNVPCLYKVENDGTDEDIEEIKKIINNQ